MVKVFILSKDTASDLETVVNQALEAWFAQNPDVTVVSIQTNLSAAAKVPVAMLQANIVDDLYCLDRRGKRWNPTEVFLALTIHYENKP